MLKSHGHLRKLYLNYRTRFWSNGLPENTAVCWSGDVPPKLLGRTRLWTDETTDEQTFEIQLNPTIRFAGCWYKFVLLHEMAHIKLYPDYRHGKKFDQEMLRLACMGAFNKLW